MTAPATWPGHHLSARLVLVGLLTGAAALLGACSSGEQTDDAEPPEAAAPAGEDLDDTEPLPPAEPVDEEPEEAPPEPEPEPLDPLQGLDLEVIAEGFSQPLEVAHHPADDRLFVVERGGLVRAVGPDGQIASEPFLDLSGVVTSGSIEQGLLGVAFHPDHPTDPRVFAYYSVPGNDNHLVSFEVLPDGTAADPTTAAVLLEIDKHPDRVRHNGGKLLFGPDGMLWVSVGDGAQASVNGQDPNTLLGTILRLDVDSGDPYAIPPDNPFATGGGAPEVYHYGLRNPWRFTIDPVDELVYIADVGQETLEEINIVPTTAAGLNLGWPILEGTLPFYGGEPASELTDPVRELTHDDGHCSITGGVVYRGDAIPELDGHYIHGDWCRGLMETFRYEDGEVTAIVDRTEELEVAQPASFGVDHDGEILIVDWGASALLRVVPIR